MGDGRRPIDVAPGADVPVDRTDRRPRRGRHGHRARQAAVGRLSPRRGRARGAAGRRRRRRPRRRDAIFIATDAIRFGPPSVKYRGVFLNDEDYGLQPWAAKTFEAENGDIGPKTYARLFELLLRLKANYCWPAMHPCTKAFNAD